MGTVIEFPNVRKNRKKVDNLLLEKLPDHEQHCDIGDVKFTCATCSTTSHFKFENIIFKICEFYCSSCGTGYKISNPLFGNKNKARSQ